MGQREAYYTPASIHFKSQEIFSSLLELKPRGQDFKPERSALLVLDMQRYFLDESSHAFIPSAPAILPAINALIQSYAQQGLPLFFTRHLNTPENAGLMASWWRGLLTPQHPLSDLDPRIRSASGRVIVKTRYDAFFDTPLADLLRERNVTQVVICGVMTHLCCETTARSAFMHGFEVFFTVDGTATYTEAFQRASLLTLTHGFATPVLTPDLLRRLLAD